VAWLRIQAREAERAGVLLSLSLLLLLSPLLPLSLLLLVRRVSRQCRWLLLCAVAWLRLQARGPKPAGALLSLLMPLSLLSPLLLLSLLLLVRHVSRQCRWLLLCAVAWLRIQARGPERAGALLSLVMLLSLLLLSRRVSRQCRWLLLCAVAWLRIQARGPKQAEALLSLLMPLSPLSPLSLLSLRLLARRVSRQCRWLLLCAVA